MKILIKENKISLIILDWLNKNYGNIKPFVDKDYRLQDSLDNKTYSKNGEKLFVHFLNDNSIWVFPQLREFLSTVFNLSNNDIKVLIEVWVKKQYNINPSKVIV